MMLYIHVDAVTAVLYRMADMHNASARYSATRSSVFLAAVICSVFGFLCFDNLCFIFSKMTSDDGTLLGKDK